MHSATEVKLCGGSEQEASVAVAPIMSVSLREEELFIDNRPR
jgi:hypothetical protein